MQRQGFYWASFGRALISATILFVLLSRPALLSAADDEAVETARRELKELPASDAAPSTQQGTSQIGNFDQAVPGLHTDSEVKKAVLDSPNQRASQGWLLDALQNPSQPERGANSDTKNPLPQSDRLGGTENKNAAKNSRRDAATSAARETSNAWNPFLQQWLSPSSQKLLARPGANGTDASLDRSSSAQIDTGLLGATKSPAQAMLSWMAPAGHDSDSSGVQILTGDATYHDPLSQRPNPYLDPNPPAQNWSPVHDTVSAPGRPETLPGGAIDAPTPDRSGGAYSMPGDMTKPVKPHEDPSALPPPNAPLLNDQKYFPQLQRF